MSIAEPHRLRGVDLLLVHCTAVTGERPKAYTRLEQAVGGELARLLVFALAGPQRTRGSSSP